MYYAHVSEDGNRQTVAEHLENVGELAKNFAKRFGAEKTAYVCGRLHDTGKCSNEFQERLFNNGPKVDHSTAGAIEIGRIYGKVYKILLGYVICGHHSGLMDYGSIESGLESRFHKVIPKYEAKNEYINISKAELESELPKNIGRYSGFTIGFFIRMIYSCLVDADFLDTEKFMNLDNSIKRGSNIRLLELQDTFNLYMKDKHKKSKRNTMNKYRKSILKDCIESGKQEIGLFSLTVPTGGGKTLSSIAFALEHIKFNNLERIIVVIPYTSIIEQNAKQYKEIFGDGMVLEHHSNFDFKLNDESGNWQTVNEKLKYAAENWDIPIIVTTNVQFFESLFANKSSRCRKLHNISNSIVIIDEAQMMPTKFLKPTLNALVELVNNYNTSVVLATATKPEFPADILALKPKEIVKNPNDLYKVLKRVSVEYLGNLCDARLVEYIDNLNQVLVIVNTRKHAEELYNKSNKDGLFHLSADMCSAHRSEVFNKIREKLRNKKKCKIISTQLIECGVDISLPVVYRALSGIDSIAQAAGRCNREGELDCGKVYVFNSTEEYGKAIMYQSRTAECGRQILEKYDDPLSLEAISEYFKYLYDIERDRLDTKDIMNNFEERANELAFSFQQTANDYKLIEAGETLIIPYNEEANKLIESLSYSKYPITEARKLQKYTITIHKNKLDELKAEGVIKIISNQFIVLDYKEGYYDENLGLCKKSQEVLMI